MVELPATEYRALVEAIAAEAARSTPAGPAELAPVLESTLLAPDATEVQIMRICDDASAWGLAAVCVNPCWLALVASRLRSTLVRAVTVIGFPLGASLGTAKVHEAAECLKLGADELDMVINLGALKCGNDTLVIAELSGVVTLAHAAGAKVKAILETPLLSEGEKRQACKLALEAGADFVKTSTGFHGGATVADVALLRSAVGDRAGVKASGGIRTAAQAMALLAAGATRLGSSHVAAILGR